jgi:hypothetical protein
MNPLKRAYPFVDLLKPENVAVLPTLAACAPEKVSNLRTLARLADVGISRAWAQIRKPSGMLDERPSAAQTAQPAQPIGAAAARTRDNAQARALMQTVEEQMRTAVDPMDIVGHEQNQSLGIVAAIGKWASGESAAEVLREALERLDKDRSFDLQERDDTARQLDELVSPAINVILAGHTHLERAMHRQHGNGCYFNSGTWARVIRIDPQLRADPKKFEQVFNLFKSGPMDQLDAFPGLVQRRCPVVVISAQKAGGISAQLCHVKSAGDSFALNTDAPASEMRL